MMEKNALWIGEIKKYNKGGVIVRAGGLQGFCPYSLLEPDKRKLISRGPDDSVDGSRLLNLPIKCIVKDVRSFYFVRNAENFVD